MLESPVNIREYGKRAAHHLRTARMHIIDAECVLQAKHDNDIQRRMMLLRAAGLHGNAEIELSRAIALIKELIG
jgi:hypothetical protein